MKVQARGRGRGGRGRSPSGALARQALTQLAEQQSLSTGTPQRGRGRGRGRRLRRPGSAPSGAANIQLTVVQDPEVYYKFKKSTRTIQGILLFSFQFEPVGVELPHDFAIQHHVRLK